MITAKKLRFIQVLQVGEVDTFLQDRLLDEATKGNDMVTIPESAITPTQRVELEKGGFSVEYNKDIHEYKISWRKQWRNQVLRKGNGKR